jgi:ATP-dependent Clp protease ATP-binding subunit ClpC
MFERFTDRARRSVVLAQEEARMLDHGYIGTEHTLLGLLSEGEGIAARVLTELGFTVEHTREGVEEIIGRGSQPSSGHIPYSPRNRKVLELALREALQLGHNFIGTEHLLLGLTRDVTAGHTAAALMERAGSNASAVRGATLTKIRETVYASDTGSGRVMATITAVKLPTSADPELAAMHAVLAALAPLDEATRLRVVTWVSARLDA